MVIAQADSVSNANRFTFVRPTYMKLEMDSAIVLEYEDSDIIRMLHYAAGYEGTESEVPARFIFGARVGMQVFMWEVLILTTVPTCYSA